MINYDRKFHTSHGMHLNTEGKEYVAKRLVSFIEAKSNKEDLAVISLDWEKAKMNDKMVENEKKE
jgi:hypothetical protein